MKYALRGILIKSSTKSKHRHLQEHQKEHNLSETPMKELLLRDQCQIVINYKYHNKHNMFCQKYMSILKIHYQIFSLCILNLKKETRNFSSSLDLSFYFSIIINKVKISCTKKISGN